MELIVICEDSFLRFFIGNSCIQIVRVKMINRIDLLNKLPNLKVSSEQKGHFRFLLFIFLVKKWCRTDFNSEAPN